MAESKVRIGIDGQSVEVSGAELEEALKAQSTVMFMRNELESAQESTADAKASAIAKLQELGLTVEEVKAAFGLEAE